LIFVNTKFGPKLVCGLQFLLEKGEDVMWLENIPT